MSRKIHGMGVEDQGSKAERERRRAQERHMQARVVRCGLLSALLPCVLP